MTGWIIGARLWLSAALIFTSRTWAIGKIRFACLKNPAAQSNLQKKQPLTYFISLSPENLFG